MGIVPTAELGVFGHLQFACVGIIKKLLLALLLLFEKHWG